LVHGLFQRPEQRLTGRGRKAVEQEPPRIEFPCEYPIKVLGRSVPEFEEQVLDVFECHAPGFDRSRVTVRASSRGNFAALTVTITATGKPQLEALHRDLMQTGLVQMVI
jgi:putative lipoic acid-binding regulatory protein